MIPEERNDIMKITFMGAGSTVFARNVIGDCMCTESLKDSVFALYDIDGARLEESRVLLEAIREAKGGCGKIECYLGVENRKAALAGATFVVNAIQVGGYDPCTITDFEIFNFTSALTYDTGPFVTDTTGIFYLTAFNKTAIACINSKISSTYSCVCNLYKHFIRL